MEKALILEAFSSNNGMTTTYYGAVGSYTVTGQLMAWGPDFVQIKDGNKITTQNFRTGEIRTTLC